MGLGSLFKRKKDKKEEAVESHIDINTSDCEGSECEKCVMACPNNVLTKNGEDTVARNPFACKHCRVCEAICPNDCIVVN
ncbi:4Fe-4S dicluster domain-containing protein [Methanobrevibacter millerae]|uniref:4Fe-4S dicluster domain-containing protein n=1 Tax=Methanobrevibacter millerae TaxID=230361 RepID=A0A1G5VLK4_9EURY|nr:4Fe-4S dicluster domain-containing protein [Methanobrevibacter millerae]SDA46608.1 4Fe-4S dicluster domain-containing protein [Methanobrevibacter millerae]